MPSHTHTDQSDYALSPTVKYVESESGRRKRETNEREAELPHTMREKRSTSAFKQAHAPLMKEENSPVDDETSKTFKKVEGKIEKNRGRAPRTHTHTCIRLLERGREGKQERTEMKKWQTKGVVL